MPTGVCPSPKGAPGALTGPYVRHILCETGHDEKRARRPLLYSGLAELTNQPSLRRAGECDEKTTVLPKKHQAFEWRNRRNGGDFHVNLKYYHSKNAIYSMPDPAAAHDQPLLHIPGD